MGDQTSTHLVARRGLVAVLAAYAIADEAYIADLERAGEKLTKLCRVLAFGLLTLAITFVLVVFLVSNNNCRLSWSLCGTSPRLKQLRFLTASLRGGRRHVVHRRRTSPTTAEAPTPLTRNHVNASA